MARQITVFIVDDIQETIESIKQLISLHEDLTVAGEARSAEEALALLPTMSVDVVLMDINMGGIDGIRAAEMLREKYPELVVILMSVQQEPEYFRRAMLAGAHNYLVKPFSSHELVTTVRETLIRQRRLQSPAATPEGKVVVVFSTKGGAGKTTLAVNLAVALKQRAAQTQVVLIDGVLAFGDVALFVNLQPKLTLYDAAKAGLKEPASWDEGFLLAGPAGVKILPAPVRPEQAEAVATEVLVAAVRFAKTNAAYVVVDLDSSFNERSLAILDMADTVLVVATPDLPSVKNVRLALDTLERIGISKGKTKVVLNRVASAGSLDVATVMNTINHDMIASLPSDGKTAMHALNKGVPFILDEPTADISNAVRRLAEAIDCGIGEAAAAQPPAGKSGWRRFWGGG